MRLGSPLSASVALHGAALALIAATPDVVPVPLRPLVVDSLHASPTSVPVAVAPPPSPLRGRQTAAAAIARGAPASDPGTVSHEGVAPLRAPVAAPTASSVVTESPPRYDAAYLDNPAPPYPAAARRRRIEGTVLLVVAVGVDGHPTAIDVYSSSGEDQLDRAALAAVRTWRFVPARRGGDAVPGEVRVPIRFRLDG